MSNGMVSVNNLCDSVNSLSNIIHMKNVLAGWWTDIKTGLPILTDRPHLVGEKLMLIVSEVAEAMEGHRKKSK